MKILRWSFFLHPVFFLISCFHSVCRVAIRCIKTRTLLIIWRVFTENFYIESYDYGILTIRAETEVML